MIGYTPSNALRRGMKVATVDWDGAVLRAVRPDQPGIVIREVLFTEPLSSVGRKARTLVTFTDRTYVTAMTNSNWIVEAV